MVTTFIDAGTTVDLSPATGSFTRQSRMALSVPQLVYAVSVPSASGSNLHSLANVHRVRGPRSHSSSE
jgi:hypothetical protein